MQTNQKNYPNAGSIQMQEKKTLAQKLSYLKEKQEMTTSELSDRSGIATGTLNKLLSGETKRPSFATVEKLAAVFGVPTRFFVDDFKATCPEYEVGVMVEHAKMRTISSKEEQLILALRSLPAAQKRMVEQAVETFAQVGQRQSTDKTMVLPCYLPIEKGLYCVSTNDMELKTIAVKACPRALKSDFAVMVSCIALAPIYGVEDIVGGELPTGSAQ